MWSSRRLSASCPSGAERGLVGCLQGPTSTIAPILPPTSLSGEPRCSPRTSHPTATPNSRRRDYFLRTQNYEACRSPLVREFGSLVRKMWITRAFKGHVSPHEFMQSVIAASEKRFTIDAQADAIDFFQWLVNRLHLELTGGKRKKASIITECLQARDLGVGSAA